MARAFDTGLALPQRTTVRNAVIAKLAPLLKSNGLYLRAVAPLAAPYHGDGDDEGLTLINMALQGQFPSALVAVGKAAYKAIGVDATDLRGDLAVHVCVACSNPRSMDDGRLAPDVTALADDTADPGIETMLEDVAQQLVGQDLGPESVYEPRLLEEDAVFTGADFTVWEQVYAVRVDRFIDPDRAITQLATSIGTKHLNDSSPAAVILETVTELDTNPPTPPATSLPVVAVQSSDFVASVGRFFPINITDGDVHATLPLARGLGGQLIAFQAFKIGSGADHQAQVVTQGDDLINPNITGFGIAPGQHAAFVSNDIDGWIQLV